MADAAAAQLSKMTMKAPTMLDKRPSGIKGSPIDVVTNIWPLDVKKNYAFYKYDFKAYSIFEKKDKTEAKREFTKQTKDDYTEQDRKTACMEIFLYLAKSENVFKGDLIYDRASILFSLEKIPGIGKEEKTFTLPVKCQNVCADAIRIEVTLKQAIDSFQVSTNDLVQVVNADFKRTDKSLMEVLNLATSQSAFFSSNFITYGNGNIYLLDPSKYGFREQDAPSIGNDKYVGIGLSKSVKILEGTSSANSKNYQACVVADVKKTAFHYDNQLLNEKIIAIYGNRYPPSSVLTRELRDIKCITIYKKATVTIGGFTNEPIGQCTFTGKDGKKMAIVTYYEQKYKVSIKQKDMPGVVDKYTRNIYPCELLKVAPNQRVKSSQANKKTVEDLIKVSAIQPELRLKQTVKLTDILELKSDQSKKLGISMNNGVQPIMISARHLPQVKLQGSGSSSMNGPSWRSAPKFVVGAKLDKWAAVCLFNNRDRRSDPSCFDKFVSTFISNGSQKGMMISSPLMKEIIPIDTSKIDSIVDGIMKKAASLGCTYVLNICDDNIMDHAQLKYDELYSSLITQEVKLSTAYKVAVEHKMQTMENIIMKTNSKNGGMNHIIANDGGILHSAETLIIGIFIQQPRGISTKEIENGVTPSMPAVIGISANNGNLSAAPPQIRDAAAQQYFTSNYKFANPKEWTNGENQQTTLKNMIVDCLKQYKQFRGKIPTKVIIYRGGVSEGQLSHIAGVERDSIIDAFHALNAAYNPILVIIAASKEHNERFYHKNFPTARPGERRVDQNLPAGVIIDKTVVNPEFNEFYLQSHKALQGTAKATKYIMLHESSGKLSMDMVETLTNSLCHLHEIVNSTTAIPTPLYVAEESAKRAVNNYHHAMGSNESYDLTELNKNLVPSIVSIRFNA